MPGASAIDFPRRSFKSLGVLESSLEETLTSPLSKDTFPHTSFKRPGPGLQRPKKRTLSTQIGRTRGPPYEKSECTLGHNVASQEHPSVAEDLVLDLILDRRGAVIPSPSATGTQDIQVTLGPHIPVPRQSQA